MTVYELIWIMFCLILLLIFAFIKCYRLIRLYKGELELRAKQIYEAEESIHESHLEIDRWTKAYDDLLVNFEAYIEDERVRRPQIYNSYEEIDDWIIKSHVEEFIEKTAIKLRIDERAKENVFSLYLHQQRNCLMEELIRLYHTIEHKFSTEGLEDIYSIVELKIIELRKII
jgi:hypothetical protein